MLKHPYLLSFCILGVALGAMTYITRHPELWLERAHEAELRAACERMDKALEKSVIETDLQNVTTADGEKVITHEIEVVERNNTRLRRTRWTQGENEQEPWIYLSDYPLGTGYRQCISQGRCSDCEPSAIVSNYIAIGVVALPIPHFGMHSSPFRYEIFEEMQNVEGNPCVVVRRYQNDGKYSEIFLDPSIGYMPRQDIQNRIKGMPDAENTGLVIWSFDDYREVSKGVFLPFFEHRKDSEIGTRIVNVNLNPKFDQASFEFRVTPSTSLEDDYYYTLAKNLYRNIGNIQNLFK